MDIKISQQVTGKSSVFRHGKWEF